MRYGQIISFQYQYHSGSTASIKYFILRCLVRIGGLKGEHTIPRGGNTNKCFLICFINLGTRIKKHNLNPLATFWNTVISPNDDSAAISKVVECIRTKTKQNSNSNNNNNNKNNVIFDILSCQIIVYETNKVPVGIKVKKRKHVTSFYTDIMDVNVFFSQ